MNKEVEALILHVEQAGVTLGYSLIAYNKGLIDEEIMDCYRDTFAVEILLYPDLVYKVNCERCDGRGFSRTSEYQEHSERIECYSCGGWGIRFIPLADALKGDMG